MGRRLAIILVTVGLVAACGGEAATPTPTPTPAPTPAPTDIFVETPEPTVEPTAEPTATPAAGQKYTIKKGDSLWAIAQEFGVKLADLKAANPGVDPQRLKIGSTLVIPGQ